MLEYLAKLVPQSWIKGLGKKIAIKVVSAEGDALQKRLVELVRTRGIAAAVGAIEAAESAAVARLNALTWLPASVRQALVHAVQEHADKLAERLKFEYANGGEEALNRAYDSAQALLIARINDL